MEIERFRCEGKRKIRRGGAHGSRPTSAVQVCSSGSMWASTPTDAVEICCNRSVGCGVSALADGILFVAEDQIVHVTAVCKRSAFSVHKLPPFSAFCLVYAVQQKKARERRWAAKTYFVRCSARSHSSQNRSPHASASPCTSVRVGGALNTRPQAASSVAGGSPLRASSDCTA